MDVNKFFTDNLDSLLIGVTASILAIILQVFVKVTVETISYMITSRLVIRNLFSLNQDKKTFIVSGSIQQTSSLSLLASPDADAAAYIVSSFKDVYPKSQLIRYYTTKNTQSVLNENIITIGGPVHNSCTRSMMENLSLGVSFDSNDNIVLDGQTFSKSINDRIDYGLVIRTSNPFSTSRKLIIIAGCGSHGVLAGSHLFDKNKEFKSFFKEFKKKRGFWNSMFNRNFLAIIKCRMTDNYISNLKVINVKTIKL